MNRRSIIALLLLISVAQYAIAQALPPQKVKKATYDYDFVRGENIVFFDDFTADKVGAFPSRWKILGINEEDPADVFPTKGAVAILNNATCFYITHGNGNFARPLWDTTGYTQQYKNNYWSVEFDFRFVVNGDNSENHIGISIAENNNRYEVIHFGRWRNEVGRETYNMSAFYVQDTSYKTDRAEYPVKYNDSLWHHYALAITNHGTFGYIDRCKFLALPALGLYFPDFIVNGRARVAMRNFTLARTDSAHRRMPETETRIKTLLTEKKFTTHAISFDKGKAEIKPESIPFITQLADFLKANPAIKLEIDGHTDSDGTATANMTLSKDRAAAIKKQLVTLGIDAARLQVKGYGDTKPVKSNDTEDGKAQNRRVEFIRL